MTLAQLPLNTPAVIISVGGEGALRCRLLDMGIIPRTKILVRKIAPMGDPIEIYVRGYELTLRKEDASKIEVLEVAE
ncbi:MAG: ferrous iron transport protein A [Clostridia bacterium]|nr:ferrous iron transport protein A [Clostridia bacterium]